MSWRDDAFVVTDDTAPRSIPTAPATGRDPLLAVAIPTAIVVGAVIGTVVALVWKAWRSR